MRILIADDSTLCRTNLKRLFDDIEDLKLAEASNGVEALDLQRSFHPDVIFMDVTMPVLDGLSALKILHLVDPDVKVIIITSLAHQRFIISDCMNNGAFAVLDKPVSRDAARKVLAQLTGGS